MSSGILALSFRHSQGQRLLSWHRLLGGSWGGGGVREWQITSGDRRPLAGRPPPEGLVLPSLSSSRSTLADRGEIRSDSHIPTLFRSRFPLGSQRD